MPTLYRSVVARDPVTHRFALILPARLPADRITAGRLRGTVYVPEPARGSRLEIEINAQPEGFRLDVVVAPILSWRKAEKLPPPESWRFCEYQGQLRYATTGGHLDDVAQALDRGVLRKDAHRLYHSHGDDFPYLPRGPWQYLPSSDPRDLAIRSRLLLDRATLTTRTVPELFEAIIRYAHLGDGPYRLKLIAEPIKHDVNTA